MTGKAKLMPNQKRKTLKGFSLGEVILAVVVLTAGLLPILGAITGALRTTIDSEAAITAAGLAQEGAELVVNVKDNGAIRNPGDAFEDFTNGFESCRIQYDDAVFSNPAANDIRCPGPGSNPYDLALNAGFYSHNGVVGTFKRKIFIDYSVANKNAIVASVVYWGSFVPAFANRTQFDHGTTGLEATCVASNKCVYSRVSLTSWR
jgi:hypothetical protein